MEQKKATEGCASCPLCKFTRNRKKRNIFYNIAQNIQKGCPMCTEANKATGQDLQKSKYF